MREKERERAIKLRFQLGIVSAVNIRNAVIEERERERE